MEIFIISLLVFALLSWLFGADSRECWDSQEWERRQDWLARR